MEFLLNTDYGGFKLSSKFIKAYPQFEAMRYSYSIKERSNPELIKAFKEFGDNGAYGTVHVVNVPDGITDMDLNDDDGWETLIYVLDGKLHYISEPDDEED